MKYLKVLTEFKDKIKELDDEEVGRLFIAMLSYAGNGIEPKLSGCERFFWSDVKNAIDGQRNNYEKKVAAVAVARECNPNNAGRITCDSLRAGEKNISANAFSSLQPDNCSQLTDISPKLTDISIQSTDSSSQKPISSFLGGGDCQGTNFKNCALNTECNNCVQNSGTERRKKLSKAFSNENAHQAEVDIIISAWNALGLTQVTKVTPSSSRGRMLGVRIEEYGLEKILKAIENIRLSRFLKGLNRSGWTITFDWFVRPENFLKVFEGNYTDPSVRGHSPPVNDDFDPDEIDRIRIKNDGG